MTTTEYLLGFITMAVATMSILVVGTLSAAEIIQWGGRKSRKPERPQPDEAPDNKVVQSREPLGHP
jgi:hypothetical protein